MASAMLARHERLRTTQPSLFDIKSKRNNLVGHAVRGRPAGLPPFLLHSEDVHPFLRSLVEAFGVIAKGEGGKAIPCRPAVQTDGWASHIRSLARSLPCLAPSLLH